MKQQYEGEDSSESLEGREVEVEVEVEVEGELEGEGD